jgi:hypothetical protein
MQAPRRRHGGLPWRAPARPADPLRPSAARHRPSLRPVAAATVMLALAGCSVLDGLDARSAAPTTTVVPVGSERPVVGRCWSVPADADRADDRRPFTPLPSCDEPHAAETWRVEDLPGRWADTPAPPVPGSAEWPAFDRDRRDACSDPRLNEFLNRPSAEQTPMGARRAPEILTGTSARPTDDQWARGARWVRCDVGLPFPGAAGLLHYSVADMYGAGGGGGRVPASNLHPLCLGSSYEPSACDQPHAFEVVSGYSGGTAARTDDAAEDRKWFQRCQGDVRTYRYQSSMREVDTPVLRVPDLGQGTGGELLCLVSWPGETEADRPTSVGSVRDSDWRRA